MARLPGPSRILEGFSEHVGIFCVPADSGQHERRLPRVRVRRDRQKRQPAELGPRNILPGRLGLAHLETTELLELVVDASVWTVPCKVDFLG
jgi:hypothetical protein